jgi:hypothetical protein
MKNPVLSYVISVYAHVKGKTMVQELTKVDYEIFSIFMFLYPIIGGILKGSSVSPIVIFSVLNYHRHKCNYFFAVPENDARVFLKISVEIAECGGIIKYLLLDQDYVVECLINSLGEKVLPLDNLRRILLARHEKGTVYFTSL